ncbi:MAG: hypothetical protein LBF37_01410 [Rickettsiales bacterium]|jgi:hypothetical protein|nr:hypothetical protein [Rickettsiales bacterium]
MRRKVLFVFSLILVGFLPYTAANANFEYDTSDPMFLTKSGDILSNSSMSFGSDILRLSQKITYGFTDRFAMAADLKYQHDLSGSEDGFSNIGLNAIYRLENTGSKFTTDALFGINFGGSKRVREPEFADTIYHAGIRVGRQWSRFTLAGTVKTSWIFDQDRGMAYIDLIPEAYVRLTDTWMTGLGLDLRKSTNPDFDREWINFKLVKQFGRTQYVGHIDYEFEQEDWTGGIRVNILF